MGVDNPSDETGAKAASVVEIYNRPDVYDALFRPDSSEIDEIAGLIRKHWGEGRPRLLDPACGSGPWLTPSLSDSASGCDLNPNMVAWTRAKIGGDIRCGDMCDLPFDSDTFDVAINPDATISHLHSYEMIGRHLSEVERVLSPGGVYLLGIPLRNEVFPRRDGDLAYDSGIRPLGIKQSAKLTLHYSVHQGDDQMADLLFQLHEWRGEHEQIIKGSFGVRSLEPDQMAGCFSKAGLELVASYYQEMPGRPSSNKLHPLGQALVVLKKTGIDFGR